VCIYIIYVYVIIYILSVLKHHGYKISIDLPFTSMTSPFRAGISHISQRKPRVSAESPTGPQAQEADGKGRDEVDF